MKNKAETVDKKIIREGDNLPRTVIQGSHSSPRPELMVGRATQKCEGETYADRTARSKTLERK